MYRAVEVQVSRAEAEVEEASTQALQMVRSATCHILQHDSRYLRLAFFCFHFQSIVPPTAPQRPASPLPPGVPTGPRNQNKYKDRDNNAPAVDGLDYGGTVKDSVGGRTPSGEPEDRNSRSVIDFVKSDRQINNHVTALQETTEFTWLG